MYLQKSELRIDVRTVQIKVFRKSLPAVQIDAPDLEKPTKSLEFS
jgi:hypothetical protein